MTEASWHTYKYKLVEFPILLVDSVKYVMEDKMSILVLHVVFLL